MDTKAQQLTGPMVVAVAFASLIWSARRAKAGEVSPQEERVFRSFNNSSDAVKGRVWTVMQYGSFGSVPLFAALVAVYKGRRRGLVVGVAGTVVWLLCKVVKRIVGRGRPLDLLTEVNVRARAQTGLGYPSGHAAVSLTLALSSTSALPFRAIAIVAAAIASGGRLYVGAHLPLDVLGGLALGAIVGAVSNRLETLG